jgi:hypothetical protein
LADRRGSPIRAARLFGAEAAARITTGTLELPAYRRRSERALAATRVALGDELFEAEWRAGQAMTLEEALAYAQEDASQ